MFPGEESIGIVAEHMWSKSFGFMCITDSSRGIVSEASREKKPGILEDPLDRVRIPALDRLRLDHWF